MPLDSDRYARFVATTLDKRIPVILKTAADGTDADGAARLEAIGRAITAKAPMVADLSNWPFLGWNELPRRVNGRRPREAAFFDFEYWFYLRILDAVRFADRRIDPFRATKHHDLDRHLNWAERAVEKTHTLAEGLRLSLDANAHDLSQITQPGSSYEAGFDALATAAEGVERMNIIADNFGAEFAADLVLGVVAAERGVDVVFHVKQLPMFVSDTTADDVIILLDRLPRDIGFGQRLQRAIDRGAVRFAANAFWSAPEFFDRMPPELLGDGRPTLNIIKGDLNFRRAIGDVAVDPDTPFEALTVRPSAPLLSLRSIKSYCVAGMAGIWPPALPRSDFPMDGSIVAVQAIPAATASA
jgi:hypothetical protein